MDMEVIEIPPSKMLEHKQIVAKDVAEVDNNEDPADAMLICEKFDGSNKGKGIVLFSDNCDDDKLQESLPSSFGLAVNGAELMNYCHSSNFPYNDDECANFLPEDTTDVDEYSMLQAHFDHMDIPPGVEAPIPWFSESTQTIIKPVAGSSSVYTENQIKSRSVGLNQNTPSSSSCVSEPALLNLEADSVNSSDLQTQRDAIHHIVGVDTRLPSQAGHSKKKSIASLYREKFSGWQHKEYSKDPSFGVGSSLSKNLWFLDPLRIKRKKAMSNSSTKLTSVTQLDAMNSIPAILKEQDATTYQQQLDLSKLLMQIETSNYPSGTGSTMPIWQESFKPKKIPNLAHSSRSIYDAFDPLQFPPGEVVDNFSADQDFARKRKNVASEGSSTTPPVPICGGNMDEILGKYMQFNKFDTVEDHSDHHYASCESSVKQSSKKWTKRIQEEWKILENGLPDTIFVRVYEARMDLLRAVIVGAEGTPYQDGLFFFDFLFPSGYPNVPPLVYYQAGGLRLNPNLYSCGKVCLSLLNTWSGNNNEKWLPGVSTILQVLVSIQGLILNEKPYFNEPAYACKSGTPLGEVQSQQYNDSIYPLSLKTMIYKMQRPPKHFEEFVIGHFCNCARDILTACKGSMDHARFGHPHDVDYRFGMQFTESLQPYMGMLVKEFTRIGVTDCEKFLSSTPNEDDSIAVVPPASLRHKPGNEVKGSII